MKLLDNVLRSFATPDVIVKRQITIRKEKVEIAYHPDLTDSALLTELIKSFEKCNASKITAYSLFSKCVCIAESELIGDEERAKEGILTGDGVIEIEGDNQMILVNLRKWDKRAVAEPPTSTVMRGPREGFIEDVKTNLSLIERKLKTPNLAIRRLTLGRQSKTTVAVVYLRGIADEKTVEKVISRLQSVQQDAMLDSHYVQPLLEERPLSIFHQTGVTEKPDIAVAKLLEGRVAVVVDGSPMVITVPFMFIEDYQSSEDYYERASLATFLRIIRLISVFFSVLLPGLYVALQEFHYSMIPLRFLITVMTAVNGIPLSPLTEILFVILLFEIIREASVRMPRAVGMAMSIVGALVLGDTAVKAGIISSPAVMITALSSIALYTAPNQEGTLTLLRVAFTLLGGAGGMYFLICGTLYLTLYMCSLNGYGVPYTAPLAPLIGQDLKDAVYRSSLLRMKKRPLSISPTNATRQGENNAK